MAPSQMVIFNDTANFSFLWWDAFSAERPGSWMDALPAA